MRCLACDAPLAGSAKFCSECGAPVLPRCSNCGQPIHSSDATCSVCGTKTRPIASDTQCAASSADGSPRDADGEAAVAERRPLTILFCDLVASTVLSTRLDLEELRDVIGAYHRCVAQSVDPFGGFVARYAGDGALVYFGFPQAFEDSPARAVRAALALIPAVAKLNTLGERLAVRIGVATGVVVVGELVNAGAAREQTALGETPNLAARVQALAKPDEIVIADSTRRLIGEHFDVEDLGDVDLKGFAAPVRAWKVLGARRPSGRVAAYDAQEPAQVTGQRDDRSGRLIGREEPLSLLADRWNASRAANGQALVVTGEAGIGKSRLVHAFAASLAGETHYELEFRGSPYYANAPLYPVVTLLPRVVGWSRADSEQAKLDKLKAFCTQCKVADEESLRLLSRLAGIAATEHPVARMSADRQKQRTLQTLLQIPLAFAAERPLLMVVEDIQWIDPTTLEFLGLLIERLPALPLFVLCTARSPFRSPWPPGVAVAVVELARLSASESEELVSRVTRGKALPAALVADVVAKTDGVPLFVEELTKALLESDALQEREDRYDLSASARKVAIPSTLHDSLTARLDRLGPAKRVAQLAAVIGREFSYAMLSAVAGMAASALRSGLARLVDAEFLYPLPDAAEPTYFFKHALIQEAAYQSLLRSTRRRYHERIANVISEEFAIDAAAHPEIVAMHYTEAARHDAALRWWQRAAQQARRRAAYAEAVSHYGRALEVLATMAEGEARDHAELALQVDLGYALIPQRGWGAAESARAFTRAGELSRRIGDAPKLFRSLWGLAAFHFVRGDQRAAGSVAGQCLAVAQTAHDIDALIEAQYIAGTVGCAAGDFVGGSEHLEQCIRLHGDEPRDVHWLQYAQDAKASALGWLALALWTMGKPDRALACASEALARVRDAPQPFVRARALAAVGFVHVLRGEPQDPASPLAQAIELCAEQHFTYFHAILTSFAAMNLIQNGRLDEGIALLQQSVARVLTIGSELLLSIVYAHLAEALCARERIGEGLAAIVDGLGCVERNGERWAEAELHRVRGELLIARSADDTAQAEAALRNALEIATSQRATTYRLRATTSLARLCARRGQRGEASELLDEALSQWPEHADTRELSAARALRDALK